ncbi:carboxylesterase/lipase family protein [Paraburkholderia aspalathi]|uniref:carboxylesterase/lipase family protein n=1 Tax=Paraburkholderia aspalathi TaxID=1324617 RepID=UPI001B11FDBF|nr:carboxylesterase family protein [Paraburkholderia aspalathi]CAE6737563.1 Para-nitrobenzyl esterase [Paraburkholderia aspalathi]
MSINVSSPDERNSMKSTPGLSHARFRRLAATGIERKHHRFMVALIATVVASGCHGQSAHSQPISSQVVLLSGTVQGTQRDANGVMAFKGMPYAAAPVGQLRWRPPQPAPVWQGTRDATAFGARCEGSPLLGPAPAGNVQSEDCLTVNVWTAAQTAGEKRPVMVWIHGGGFQTGVPTPASPTTDGSGLAADGVVLVSLNYRLGVFGFLAHPALDSEGTPSGNFGLQDQIAALKWVRSNISRFGGDPDNVTIFGQSAGAMSVGILMSSPLAHGLFQKAIGESGAFWDSEHGSLQTLAEARVRGEALATQLAGGDINGLRAISADALLTAAPWSIQNDPVTGAFSPSVDGYVLPDSPANVFAHGRQSHVPLLAGRNGAEGVIFMSGALPHDSAASFEAAAAAQFGPGRLSEFLDNYPASSDTVTVASAQTLIGDLRINEQSWEWIQLQRQTGAAPVYAYQFNYNSPYLPAPVHASEVPFVFGTLTPQPAAPAVAPGTQDRALSNQMMNYWINFARTGNPNGPGLPCWPAYAINGSQVMLFGTTSHAAPESDTSRLRFLRSFRFNGRFPDSWRQTG